MKVTIIEPIPVPQPPRKVLIELTEQEALIVRTSIGNTAPLEVANKWRELKNLYKTDITFSATEACDVIHKLHNELSPKRRT